MKTTAYAIKIKGFGKEDNGLDKIVWATESQVNEIRRRYNDPELRGTMVTIGKISFPILGVLVIEEKEKETYDLPKYFLDRNSQENGIEMPKAYNLS